MASTSFGAPSHLTSSIMLRGVDDGGATLLSIRAQPGAKRKACLGEWNGRLKLAVTERALDGRANEALVALVAELFGVPRARVALVSGERSRDKTVRIEASFDDVRARLAELLA